LNLVVLDIRDSKVVSLRVRGAGIAGPLGGVGRSLVN
jgi:hypothetical protein